MWHEHRLKCKSIRETIKPGNRTVLPPWVRPATPSGVHRKVLLEEAAVAAAVDVPSYRLNPSPVVKIDRFPYITYRLENCSTCTQCDNMWQPLLYNPHITRLLANNGVCIAFENCTESLLCGIPYTRDTATDQFLRTSAANKACPECSAIWTAFKLHPHFAPGKCSWRY